MTNLEEIFTVVNGQEIDDHFQVTMELIRKCRKERFVEVEDDVKPLRSWIKELQADTSPYRITYLSHSISLKVLQNAFRAKQIPYYIRVVGIIKSEMMGCATAENFQTVKDLYTFWDGLELTLQQIDL